jgi:hypothetical protein
MHNGFRMRLNFINPHKMIYDIQFIAQTLGKIGRFNNIGNRHMSVAEHCYHASYLYPDNPLGALMHDAPEAITGDITTHLKRLLGEAIKEIEHRIEDDMVSRFNYRVVGGDFKEAVDRPLFYKEEEALFGSDDCHKNNSLPQVRLYFWDAPTAAVNFLERYYELKHAQS